MLFSSLLAAVTVLTTSVSAAVLARNKHVADFRIFGATGCYNENLGVWTVIDDDIKGNPCTAFHDHVKSVKLSDINKGCELHLFTDANCKTGEHVVQSGQCSDGYDGLKAWSMKCDY